LYSLYRTLHNEVFIFQKGGGWRKEVNFKLLPTELKGSKILTGEMELLRKGAGKISDGEERRG
jgi:hypothetical protein